LAQVRSGKIKAFAVTAKSRLVAAPEIPSVDEAGLPGFYTPFWFGLWAPKDTPRSIIEQLNAAAVEVMADTIVQSRLAELGSEIPTSEQQNAHALVALQKPRSTDGGRSSDKRTSRSGLHSTPHQFCG
jgi:tripartite-type tricarboxylate transporter receptor subunit TctC